MWDVRTFQPLHAYFANSPATALDVSQRGLLAVGQGRRLQVRSLGGGGEGWLEAVRTLCCGVVLYRLLARVAVQTLGQRTCSRRTC